jgi:hypothetical protein
MFKVIGRGKAISAVFFLAASSVWAVDPKTVVVHQPPDSAKRMLKSFTITPGSVINGIPAKGLVTLTGPAGSQVLYVAFAQLTPGFAGVAPTQGVFNGDSATFDLATMLVIAPTNASVSASFGGVTKTATLQVLPAKITDFKPTKTNLVGGTSTPASLTLNGSVPTDAVIKIVSNVPALVWADGPVQVNNSDHTGFVMLNTAAVPRAVQVKVTASYAGSTQQKTLTLNPH